MGVNFLATGRSNPKPQQSKSRPATTPEGRENQLIALAYEAAENQIRDGRASSQVITHFLKLGSTREDLEKERLRGENKLLTAKVDRLASEGRMEALYERAIKAMQIYQGKPPSDDEDEMLRRAPED